MRFVKTNDSSKGQAELLDYLRQSLQKGQVLWLLSGGGNIPVEVNILNELEDSLSAKLNILLADERYGPPGHKDSNYQQLLAAGLKIKRATFPNILTQVSPEASLRLFSNLFEKFKSQSLTTIGQLGIGDDGHIAGVLPNSKAIESHDIATYYESKPYKRITLTLETLKSLDRIDIFCFGPNKLKPLARLKDSKETIESLPALILKEIADVTVYNDQLED